MNIINDSMFIDENSGMLTKTKRVVKMAIKGTAYTAFLGIAVASALHLYSNPEDRQSVGKGLSSIVQGVKAEVNNSYSKLTGSTLSQHIQKTENIAQQEADKILGATQVQLPTTEDGKSIINKTKVVGEMITSDIKKHSPEFAKIIKSDTEKSASKVKSDTKELKTEVSEKIRDLRQYGIELTDKLNGEQKPSSK